MLDFIHKHIKERTIIRMMTLVLIVSCLSVGCNVEDRSVYRYSKKYDNFKMENGLEVAVIDDGNVPTITFVGAFKSGSLCQSEDEIGIFHLLEHMLMAQIQDDIHKIGAEANAYTSEDYLMFYISVTRDKWEEALDILRNIMVSPKFQEDIFEREYNVVLYEAKNKLLKNGPITINTLRSELWTDNKFRLNTVGDEDTLRNIDINNIKITFDNYCVPEKALIMAAGNTSDIDIKGSILEEFGSWNKELQRDEEDSLIIPDLQENKKIIVGSDKDKEYSTLLIMWNGPGLANDPMDSCTGDLFCRVLNNPSSPFWEKINRIDYIRIYEFSYTSKANYGPLLLKATVASHKIMDAIDVVIKETLNMDNYNDTADEVIQNCKKSITYDWAIAQESSSDTAKLYTRVWAMKDFDYAKNYIDNINSIDQKALMDFTETYIKNKHYVWGASVQEKYMKLYGEVEK